MEKKRNGKMGEGMEGAAETPGAAMVGRDEFAALMMGHCRKKGRSMDLVYDPAKFEMTDQATGVHLSLSNAYAGYCLAPEGRRQEVLANYAEFFSKMPQLPRSFSEAEGRLFPVVKNRWACDMARLADAPRILSRRLTDNLAVAVAYDLPTAVVYLQEDTLKAWGISEDAVFAVAIGNMRKLMTDRIVRVQAMPVAEFAAVHGMTASQVWEAMRPFAGPFLPPPDPGRDFIRRISIQDLGFGRLSGYPGLFAERGDDWLCSSRILVEDWIRVLPVKGDLVAMVSHTGDLLVTGTDDPQSLMGMAELTKSRQGREDPVSNMPIRLAPKGWETYLPPPGHPARAAFQSLRSEEMLGLHTRQQGTFRGLTIVDGFVPPVP